MNSDPHFSHNMIMLYLALGKHQVKFLRLNIIWVRYYGILLYCRTYLKKSIQFNIFLVPWMLCYAKSLQSCPALYEPMDCSLPGSPVHKISQARILEWVAISFSSGSSQRRNLAHISCDSCISRQILYYCTTWEALSTDTSLLMPGLSRNLPWISLTPMLSDFFSNLFSGGNYFHPETPLSLHTHWNLNHLTHVLLCSFKFTLLPKVSLYELP